MHALKSSARIIGAVAFGEEAQLLENAGKAGDTGYICSHHDAFMQGYTALREILSPMFKKSSEPEDRPEADESIMNEAYEAIAEAAKAMEFLFYPFNPVDATPSTKYL